MINLKHVTITGADNSAPIEKLVELSERFPDTEWGILFSKKHEDAPRFPSSYWVADLVKAVNDIIERNKDPKNPKQIPMKLSAHLCGRDWVRNVVSQTKAEGAPEGLVRGWFEDRKEFVAAFQRIQFNFHAEDIELHDDFFKLLQEYPDKEFIFQFDGKNESILDKFKEYGLTNAVALFDVSGGRGIVPDAWPAHNGELCGYAGGLGPDNLTEQLAAIEAVVGDKPIWIDMETKVRSDNDAVFDMNKVLLALTAAVDYRQPPMIDEEDDLQIA